jgi:ribosomal silencing factor RsfS
MWVLVHLGRGVEGIQIRGPLLSNVKNLTNFYCKRRENRVSQKYGEFEKEGKEWKILEYIIIIIIILKPKLRNAYGYFLGL